MRLVYTIRDTGYFCESRVTNKKYAEQTCPVGRADLGVPQQRSEHQGLVQRKWYLRADLLQMAEATFRDSQGTAGGSVRGSDTGTTCSLW